MIKKLPNLNSIEISVLGLGYVGLPLAVQISKVKKHLLEGIIFNRKVIGFDINSSRIDELKNGFDRTKEVTYSDLTSHNNLEFTSNKDDLLSADIFIVTVPTLLSIQKNVLNCLH